MKAIAAPRGRIRVGMGDDPLDCNRYISTKPSLIHDGLGSLAGARRYFLAVGIVLIAWSLLQLAAPLQVRPYLVFLAAIVLATWHGGVGPGIAATFTSCVLIERTLLPALVSWTEVVHLASFTAVALVVTVLNDRRVRAEVSERQARERFRAESEAAAKELEQERTRFAAAEESLRFLQETSMTLARSLDFDLTLRSVVQLAVPRLADWCLLHTVESDESPPRMTAAHLVAEKARVLETLYAEYPVPADARHGYPFVMRTGEIEFVPDVPPGWVAQARDPRHAGYLRQLEIRSLICLPLRVAGRTVGALTLVVGDSGRRYAAADCRLAEHFARRVATAIDNARLYREIAEADRRKSEFLALMAHELRNPLAPMRNAVEILRLTDDRDTTEHMRSLLERQLGHMVRMIDDLVDLSRLERNKIALRLESLDVTAIVRRAIDAHRDAVAARLQSLVETIPPQPLIAYADAARLEQVVSNLLDNASKYTAAHGRVDVCVEGLPDVVRVAIRDSGRGIEAELLPHVFDSFRRGDRPGLGVNGGLGVGLTLVKRLVELHGGTVTARSAGTDQGSEFVVILPRLSTASGRVAAPPATDLVPAMRRLRALVCDDNVRAADTLGTLLQLWGYDLSVVYDGESALARAREQVPDVALLDLALPGIDGYEVATRLRHLPSPPLLIVAISGHGQDEDRRRSYAAGFDHHLVKPIDPPALEALLRQHAHSVAAPAASGPLPSLSGRRSA